jgi:ribosomal-protein-serine acetyltransferase
MTTKIRRYRTDDAEAIYAAATESVAEIHPWLPWCHPGYTISESRIWIEHCGVAWERGSEFNFVVTDDEDRLLGSCGLNQIRSEHGIANLGYWIRTSATRRGAATAAVSRLADFAFSDTALTRLEIVVAVGNDASERVAEKCGAIREGIAHDRLRLHGRPHDAVIYALLRSRHPAG